MQRITRRGKIRTTNSALLSTQKAPPAAGRRGFLRLAPARLYLGHC